MKNIFQRPRLADIQRLLVANNLLIDDLSDVDLDDFFAYGEVDSPDGVIGLEIHGSDGLLRSLSVNSEIQGRGCGSALISTLEEHSRQKGIRTLYLLTETAKEYFQGKGFEEISRECVPDSIKTTAQFGDLCPSSAVLMRKNM